MIPFTRSSAASRIALAVALAAGTMVVAAPANAQRLRDQSSHRDEKPAKPGNEDYSKAFVAIYQPMAKSVTDGTDPATLKAQIPGLIAAATTPSDKFAAGQMVYSVGSKSSDIALQRQGLDMMLDSGKTPPDAYARNVFAAGQLAYEAKDWAAARARIQQAIDAGYKDNDPELLLAEAYFGDDQAEAGVAALDKAIAAKVAAGQQIPESWLKRGLAMAYQGNLDAQATKYAGMYAQYYPSANSWGDAIAIERNMHTYDDQELLDLMRLADTAHALRNQRDYVDYISAADARRLPGEVQRVIKEGLAAGMLKSGDVFVNDANTMSAGRVTADLASLPGLEKDARANSATVATIMAAGDAFLSYQQPAKAEEFYNLALAKPGVDTARVLTRLGIAQVQQGKNEEAKATFAKVEGARQAIARLWSLYSQQAKPSAQ
jgi:hypothetical protein